MASFITAGNATNGLQVSSDNTGILELRSGTGAGTTAVSIDTSQNVTFAGTITQPTGTTYPIVRGTAVASTSGTSIDFTNIPSWVKRITVMFNGVSTSGTSTVQIQLGSGSVDTSGYTSSGNTTSAGGTNAITSNTAGIVTGGGGETAASVRSGVATIANISGNIWVASSLLTGSNMCYGGGTKTLSGTLDRIRITTVNGTDTFDAGSINILYE